MNRKLVICIGLVVMLTLTAILAVPVNAQNPTIGLPPDRSYTVLSSSEVLKPFVGCGFNDLSLPNPAIFRREIRQYYRHVNGKLLPDGPPQQVDIFLRCHKI